MTTMPTQAMYGPSPWKREDTPWLRGPGDARPPWTGRACVGTSNPQGIGTVSKASADRHASSQTGRRDTAEPSAHPHAAAHMTALVDASRRTWHVADCITVPADSAHITALRHRIANQFALQAGSS